MKQNNKIEKVKSRKVYLSDDDWNKLKAVATQSGFTGKGFVSHFLKKVGMGEFAFLDENLKKMLKVLLPRVA